MAALLERLPRASMVVFWRLLSQGIFWWSVLESVELIKKILRNRGISQRELAALCNIDSSQISRYLSGDRIPSPFACLILSGFAEGADRVKWVTLSGLSRDQLHLLSRALGTPEPRIISTQDRALLEWFRAPADSIETSIRDLVTQLLAVRTQARK